MKLRSQTRVVYVVCALIFFSNACSENLAGGRSGWKLHDPPPTPTDSRGRPMPTWHAYVKSFREDSGRWLAAAARALDAQEEGAVEGLSGPGGGGSESGGGESGGGSGRGSPPRVKTRLVVMSSPYSIFSSWASQVSMFEDLRRHVAALTDAPLRPPPSITSTINVDLQGDSSRATHGGADRGGSNGGVFGGGGARSRTSYLDLHTLAAFDACGFSQRFPFRDYELVNHSNPRQANACGQRIKPKDPHLAGGFYLHAAELALHLLRPLAPRRCDPPPYTGPAGPPLVDYEALWRERRIMVDDHFAYWRPDPNNWDA